MAASASPRVMSTETRLDEIVAGVDSGGGGCMAVFDDAAHNYALLKWIQVQWSAYNAANGEVWPAVGDLDGDGRAEIVAGLVLAAPAGSKSSTTRRRISRIRRGGVLSGPWSPRRS